MADSGKTPRIKVKRVQTGVRIEQRMLKVLTNTLDKYETDFGAIPEAAPTPVPENPVQ